MNQITPQTTIRRMLTASLATIAALTLLVLITADADAYPSGSHLYKTEWVGKPTGLLSQPNDATVVGNNVYVVDTGNNRIQVFDQDGNFKFAWGQAGAGNGQFNSPLGIDSEGNRIYVADQLNHRIQVFDLNGQFVGKFGTQGTGLQQFTYPRGVAINNNVVYIADAGNNRVDVWVASTSDTYTYATSIGSAGSGNGQFSTPFGVDATSVPDSSNSCGYHYEIYVADTLNNRIQKFTSGDPCLGGLGGTYTAQWASGTWPSKVKVAPNGNIYAVATVSYQVRVTTSTGVAVTSWGSSGNANGQFQLPRGIGIAANGKVFVADGSNNRVQRFSASGTYETKWGISQNGDGEFDAPSDVTRDSAGNYYVVDTNNNRVEKFSDSGRYLLQWGSTGSGNGQFVQPKGITVDASDKIYVADGGNNRVQVFNTSGVYQSTVGSAGSGNGQLAGPSDVAVIGTTLYVVDSSNNRIQAFDSSGAYITKWGSSGGGDGQFSFANSITAAGGYLLVSDNSRIQVFNYAGGFVDKLTIGAPVSGVSWQNNRLAYIVPSTGQLTVVDPVSVSPFSWGLAISACDTGDGPTQTASAAGLYLNSNGSVAVADNGNNRVQIMGVGGLPLQPATWECTGYSGFGTTKFNNPMRVADAPNGDIYVGSNGKINRFTAGGQAISRWGLQGGPDGFETTPAISVAPDSTVVAIEGTKLRRFSSAGAPQASATVTSGTDVAVAPSGDIYVLNGTQVSRYNSSMVSLGSWGSSGSADGQFSAASGIDVDSTGNVYVADTLNNRVQVFNSTGTFQRKFASNRPADVSVGPTGRTYVVTATDSLVRSYDDTGSLLETIGSPGTGNGQFSSPRGLTYSEASNQLVVSDYGNQRVELFDWTPSRTLFDSKLTDYGGNELNVPAENTTTVTGGF